MPATLLVGCSFLARLTYRMSDTDLAIDAKKYHVLASSGSGNQAIAARTIYQLSEHQYDHVIVLWSGINRVDFPISCDLHKTYPPNTKNQWTAYCSVGSMAWYHSGGILGTGTQNSHTPKSIKKFFQTQYLGAAANSCYLTDLSLLSIISTQAVLDSRDQSYQMAFIYDTQRNTFNHEQEHSFGCMDTSSPLYNMINWKKFCRFEAPYEWAKMSGKLETDQLHPTRNAMIEWFRLAMNIDLQQ